MRLYGYVLQLCSGQIREVWIHSMARWGVATEGTRGYPHIVGHGNKCIEKADKNMVDMIAEQALKNEVKEQMESLVVEKEAWEREKQELVRDKEQLNVRWRFSQSCVSALQAIVKNELEDKKRIWIVVVYLIGVLVAMLFGVVLKMKWAWIPEVKDHFVYVESSGNA